MQEQSNSSGGSPLVSSGLRRVSWARAIENSVAVYYLTAMIMLFGVYLGLDLLPGGHDSPPKIQRSEDELLRATSHWDGQFFLQIAWHGYSYDSDQSSNVAFFPVYPALVAMLFHGTGMPIEVAGLLVAHASLLIAFVLLFAYVEQRYDKDGREIGPYTLVALSFFPAAFFMRMTYSESTFLLLAVLVFFGMQRRWRPIALALIVGLATATRPVGVALLPPFLLYVWRQSESHRRAIWQLAWLVPLALWGLLAYMAFQYLEFGTPLAFVQTQSHWRTRPEVGWLEQAAALLSLEPIWSSYLPTSPGYSGRFGTDIPAWFNLQMANSVFFVGAVVLVAWGALKRWLTTSEVLLAAGLLLIPYVTRSFEMCMASQGRFVTVAFPIYLVLGRLLWRAPITVSAGLLGLSAVYMAVYAALFAAGFFVI